MFYSILGRCEGVPRFIRGQKNRTRKKNKFLGTEVPRNFSDQCSLDFTYFLCLFSGRRAKSSQELCSWELFFLILGGFSPSDSWVAKFKGDKNPECKLSNGWLRSYKAINLPKGPFRTKNTTALNSVAFYYCRSFSLSVAICCLFPL